MSRTSALQLYYCVTVHSRHLIITLPLALLYTSAPVSHDSMTMSQHVQYEGPETEAVKWNSAIINVIIYPCAFPNLSWKISSKKVLIFILYVRGILYTFGLCILVVAGRKQTNKQTIQVLLINLVLSSNCSQLKLH